MYSIFLFPEFDTTGILLCRQYPLPFKDPSDFIECRFYLTLRKTNLAQSLNIREFRTAFFQRICFRCVCLSWRHVNRGQAQGADAHHNRVLLPDASYDCRVSPSGPASSSLASARIPGHATTVDRLRFSDAERAVRGASLISARETRVQVRRFSNQEVIPRWAGRNALDHAGLDPFSFDPNRGDEARFHVLFDQD